MNRRMLFEPEEYRDLSPAERDMLRTGYDRALDALRRNMTPRGFSACSLADNDSYGTDVNYRSVWARDGAMTVIWSLDIQEPEIRACQKQTLATLLSHPSPTGQVPSSVGIDSGLPDYSGVGGIASIDSGMWVVIAMYRYANESGDWSLVQEHRHELQRCMDWLSAHDSNNCGMLEIPEAGDWTDLFGRSYHVLYDEVLWYRCLICYAEILSSLGEAQKAKDYQQWAQHVRKVILENFWPTSQGEATSKPNHLFTKTQYSLGDARYLVAQTSPFGFSWRCDVYGNLLAYMNNLIDSKKAMMTFRFLWGSGVNEPGPVACLYPPVQAGDPEWRDYFTVNLLNLPHHYHNGGIWPFIGSMWVRYIHKLGLAQLARREMVKLSQLCQLGVAAEWEFNEWHHGRTGRPMGKAFQAWSAAGFLQAAHDLGVDPQHIEHHE